VLADAQVLGDWQTFDQVRLHYFVTALTYCWLGAKIGYVSQVRRVFSLPGYITEIRCDHCDFAQSTLNHMAGFTKQKLGTRILTRLILEMVSDGSSGRLGGSVSCCIFPGASDKFWHPRGTALFPFHRVFSVVVLLYMIKHTHTHAHTHVRHARTFRPCIQCLQPAASLLSVFSVNHSDLACRRWFLIAWPTSTSPALCPTICQCFFVRHVCGSFNSRWQELDNMAVIITLKIW
jgi:hypothetical protein